MEWQVPGHLPTFIFVCEEARLQHAPSSHISCTETVVLRSHLRELDPLDGVAEGSALTKVPRNVQVTPGSPLHLEPPPYSRPF